MEFLFYLNKQVKFEYTNSPFVFLQSFFLLFFFLLLLVFILTLVLDSIGINGLYFLVFPWFVVLMVLHTVKPVLRGHLWDKKRKSGLIRQVFS